jgi:hypothetical protein
MVLITTALLATSVGAAKAPRVIRSVTVTTGPVTVLVCLRVRVLRLGVVGSSGAAGVLSVGEAAAGVLSTLTAALLPDDPDEEPDEEPDEPPATTSTSMHEV